MTVTTGVVAGETAGDGAGFEFCAGAMVVLGAVVVEFVSGAGAGPAGALGAVAAAIVMVSATGGFEGAVTTLVP